MDMGTKQLHLSVIDQTMYRSYIRIIMIFPFPDSNKIVLAQKALKTGLHATLTHWPYLAGTIGPVDQAGNLLVTYSDQIPDTEESRTFASSHLEDYPFSYAELKEEAFPPSKIRIENWVPDALRNQQGIASPLAEGRLGMTSALPILSVQAFLIYGGLVLSFYIHHTIMDGGGFSAFSSRLAENVRLQRAYDAPDPEDPSEARLTIDRRFLKAPPAVAAACAPLVSSSNSSAAAFESSVSSPILQPQPIPDCTPCIFTFAREDLARLRDDVIVNLGEDPNDKENRLTVFQILSALIWTHVTRSRKPHLDPDSKTQCAVAVNLRTRVNRPHLDEDSIGNASTLTSANLHVSQLLEEEIVTTRTIAIAAAAIRKAIRDMDPDASEAQIARLATATVPDDLFSFNYPQEVFITSWASWDFGGQVSNWDIPGTEPSLDKNGKERVVVRKPFSKEDRSVLVYPRPMGKLGDGGTEAPYEILLQLRGDDMERLLAEEGGLVSRAERVAK